MLQPLNQCHAAVSHEVGAGVPGQRHQQQEASRLGRGGGAGVQGCHKRGCGRLRAGRCGVAAPAAWWGGCLFFFFFFRKLTLMPRELKARSRQGELCFLGVAPAPSCGSAALRPHSAETARDQGAARRGDSPLSPSRGAGARRKRRSGLSGCAAPSGGYPAARLRCPARTATLPARSGVPPPAKPPRVAEAYGSFVTFSDLNGHFPGARVARGRRVPLLACRPAAGTAAAFAA